MLYPTLKQLQRVYQRHIEVCTASPMGEYPCVCGGVQVAQEVRNGPKSSACFYECTDCGRSMFLRTHDGAELEIDRG